MRVLDGVGDGSLRDSQERRLDLHGQIDRVGYTHVDVESLRCPLGVGEPPQCPAESPVVKVGWGEFADEPACIGKIAGCRLSGEADVFGARAIRVGSFGGVEEHLDAGEALRDGVVGSRW